MVSPKLPGDKVILGNKTVFTMPIGGIDILRDKDLPDSAYDERVPAWDEELPAWWEV